MKESFPDCIQYWYVVRVIWRMNHLMAKFAIFTFFWVICGGVWLPIFCGISSIIWTVVIGFHAIKVNANEIIDCCDGCELMILSTLYGIASMVAITVISKEYASFMVMKSIESTIALIIITIFGVVKFNGSIFADFETRALFGNDNDRVLIYWIIGITAHIIDIILYSILYYYDIIWDKKETRNPDNNEQS